MARDEPNRMPDQELSWSGRQWPGITALAAAFALLVGVLPVMGILIRWIALTFKSPSDDALTLAWNAPAGQLVAGGVEAYLSFGIGTVLGGIMGAGFAIAFSRPSHNAQVRAIQSRLPSASTYQYFMRGLLGGFAVSSALTGEFPSGLILAAFFALLVWVVSLRSTSAIYLLAYLVGVVVLLTANASVTGRLSGVVAGDYHFKPDLQAQLHNGRFVQIGESGTTVYLQDCAHKERLEVVALDVTSITAVRLDFHDPRSDGPSSIALAWNWRHPPKVLLGYRSPC